MQSEIKPVFFLGTSRTDLRAFPAEVRTPKTAQSDLDLATKRYNAIPKE